MAADEKSTLKLFFDCKFHTLHTRVPTQKLDEICIKHHSKICRWYLLAGYTQGRIQDFNCAERREARKYLKSYEKLEFLGNF